jgi:hypothetical protein
MIRPVIRRDALIIDDVVESLVKDKKLECVRIGQTGYVTKIEGNNLRVLLKCGHIWEFNKKQVKKIGHRVLSPLEKRLALASLSGEKDEYKPSRRRRVGRSKVQ